MSHRIANFFYAVGSAFDRPTGIGRDESFGDEYSHEYDAEATTTSANVHTRPSTAIRGSFKPGDFTYAALTIGDQSSVTIFLSRPITKRLISVLREIDASYDRFGEGRR